MESEKNYKKFRQKEFTRKNISQRNLSNTMNKKFH